MRWVLIFAALLVFAGCESQPQQPPGKQSASKEQPQALKPAAGETVRPVCLAGSFYPADTGKLKEVVEGYIKAAGEVKVQGRVAALISPHAGYVFSGPVAGYAYAAVKGESFDTVVVLGSHMGGPGASVLDWDWYQTPLGFVRVDREVVKKLLEKPYISFDPRRHGLCPKDGGGWRAPVGKEWRENAIEAQVPFLQAALKPGFRIVAISVTDFDAGFVRKVAEALAEELKGKKALLVASTDLSHYPAYNVAKVVDGKMVGAWKTLDGEAIVRREAELSKEYAQALRQGPYDGCAMCGKAAVAIAVEAAKMMDADSIDLLKYANSGDVPVGDRNQVVGYGAAAVYEKLAPGEISKAGQRYLLKVAREAMTAAAKKEVAPKLGEPPAEVRVRRGVFVSIKKEGRNRGCIGIFEPDRDLPEMVADRAVLAAMEDDRFPVLKPEELSEIEVEISVLSPLRKVGSADEVEFGKHGVYIIEKGGRKGGTYLPSVAEHFETKEDFLSDLCASKARLSKDAWKTDRVEIYVYTAQVFGEKK